MFVPSIGFCLLCGELLSVDLAGLWTHLSERWLDESLARLHSWTMTFMQQCLPVGVSQFIFGKSFAGIAPRGKKAGLKHVPIVLTTPSMAPLFSLGLQSVYLGLLPILLMCSSRVVSRNEDWRSEMALFSSALQVCPLSVKALSNYAMLRMSEPNGGVSASLQASLTAVDLFPEQVSALINSALAYQVLGDFANAAQSLQLALTHAPNNSKAHGYFGNLLFVWSIEQPDQTQANVVREQALVRLVESAERGFNAPMNYHRIGSLYIDLEENEEGALYLEAALHRSTAMRTMYSSAGTGQMALEDDINVPYTYNQLGMAYWRLGRSQDAIDSFNRGLSIRSDTVQIHTNLGNLHRELGQIAKAREVMNTGLSVMGSAVPPALLNNLGLLELEQGNYERSLELFRYALERNQDLSSSVEGTIGGGKNVVDVINSNILRAESGMVERSRTRSV
jgi:tetratricopeptide (TPR) repeat protein